MSLHPLLSPKDGIGNIAATIVVNLPQESLRENTRRKNSREGISDEDFIVLSSDDAHDDLGLGVIPPLEGSVRIGKTKGCRCPYIFMTKDPYLLKALLDEKSRYKDIYKQEAIIRTIPLDDDTRITFIGFKNYDDATQFYYDITWDDGVEGEIFFNGHKVLCGDENFAYLCGLYDKIKNEEEDR